MCFSSIIHQKITDEYFNKCTSAASVTTAPSMTADYIIYRAGGGLYNRKASRPSLEEVLMSAEVKVATPPCIISVTSDRLIISISLW